MKASEEKFCMAITPENRAPAYSGKVRDIVLYGTPVLREIAKPIEDIDRATHELVADMIATLKKAQGLGLAANQVGATGRVFIVDLSPLDIADEMRVFINPEILSSSGEVEYEEGCLSIPDVFEKVTRPAVVTARARDLAGKVFEITAEEILARVIQHELDHLNGKLFIDHLPLLTRQLLSGKLRRIKSGDI